MKSLVVAGLMAISLTACRHEQSTVINVTPEDPNWYVLKAPEARPIEGVYGNIDGTLVVTTGPRIYQTKDKGKTWVTANYKEPIGLFGFASKQDTLLALNTKSGIGPTPTDVKTYATNASYYSVDQGISWLPYRAGQYANPIIVPLNRVNATSGTEYRIDEKFIPYGTNSYYYETVGVKTSQGKMLRLPQTHQIKSLYFDSQSRLYVAASAAVCGGTMFTYCSDENGVLYVSKQPLN